jgi:NADH-quinone oxidoreductase subunit H
MGIEILGLPMMYYIAMVAKVLVAFIFVLLTVAYATYAERKVIGHMQIRLGPMTTGWHGLLQPIADGVKLFFKEEIIPTNASVFAYMLAPCISLIPAFITFAVIPFGGVIEVAGYKIPLQIAAYFDTAAGKVLDVNVGVLYILAMSSLGVYGTVLAGWASNSKYSLLGGLRASAQMISYELSAALAIVSVFMLSGTLSMNEIVNQQSTFGGFNWYIFKQPLAAYLFFVCSIAEINRVPFDLPEAENELVSGFSTEYSSMKYAMFFMAEYANMFTVCAIFTTLFLGGWSGPLAVAVPILGPVYFVAKVYFMMFLCIWIRATLPRYRYDQLMHLGWKVFLPIGLLNIVATGIIGYFIN